MRLLHRLCSGFAALLHKAHAERDLDEELRAFLEADVDARMRAGVSREDALRAARAHIGSLEAVKDRARDAGWESRLESVWRDVRYAIRGLRRSPGFAAVAVVTLALGIGANSAVFSVVNGLLLRSLPVTAPERLAMISTQQSLNDGFGAGWNFAMWDQFHQRAQLFDGAIAWTYFPQQFDLADTGESDPADGLFVSGEFFSELGVAPVLGRTLLPKDDALGTEREHAAVISYGFWQRRFGGAPDAIGRRLLINRAPVTIVGVTPAGFLGPEVGRAFEIALPIGSAPAILNEPTWAKPEGRSYLAVMLRLKPGQTRDSASALLRGMQHQIIDAAMPRNGIWGEVQDDMMKDPIVLTPASAGTSELRRQYTQPLLTVLAIAAAVLLVACVNIANLLLARATSRQHELQVRLAIGASRWRILQQMLVESLLLSAVGASLGLGVAAWGSRTLVAQLSTWFDRIVLDVSLDWRVVAFTAGVAVATGVLFGMAPAVTAFDLARQGGGRPPIGARRTDSRRAVVLRGGLLVAQVALSLVLVVAAGLLVRTFQKLGEVPLGFDRDRVLVVRVNASRSTVDSTNPSASYLRLLDATRGVPGVAHAAVSLNTPVNRGVTFVADFRAVGGRDLPLNERRSIVNLITPGWFETYGAAIKAGRPIQDSDTTSTPSVVVVNEAFAQKFFGRQSVVGEYIAPEIRGDLERPTPMLIVGVVSNSVDQSLRYEAVTAVYQPVAQFTRPIPMAEFSLSLRAASGSPAALTRSVAAALTTVDRNLAFSFHLLDDQVRGARNQERLVAWLSGFFGVLALLLAAIGLYGVTSYIVARRQTEIGIRLALGAQRADVIRVSVGQTAITTAIGVIVGLGAAAIATRSLKTLLFGVTPLDAATYVSASVVLATVALVTCYLPVRRATRIDPMIALRSE
ncbi:MAG TPA: ABC transporter permease [Vicinamibacterales bacterium]